MIFNTPFEFFDNHKLSNRGNILAIDFGLKKTGLAISSCENFVVFPLKNLIKTIDFQNETELLLIFNELILKKDIQYVLFGYPLTLQSERHDICNIIDFFISNLNQINLNQNRSNLFIIKVDERFTTQIALKKNNELFQANFYKKNKNNFKTSKNISKLKNQYNKQYDDKFAACEILNFFLSFNNQ